VAGHRRADRRAVPRAAPLLGRFELQNATEGSVSGGRTSGRAGRGALDRHLGLRPSTRPRSRRTGHVGLHGPGRRDGRRSRHRPPLRPARIGPLTGPTALRRRRLRGRPGGAAPALGARAMDRGRPLLGSSARPSVRRPASPAGRRAASDLDVRAGRARRRGAQPEAGEAFADKLLGSGFQIDQEVSRALLAQRGQWLRDAAIRDTVLELDVPALVVFGAGDLRPSTPARELAHSLQRAELLLVPGAGHFPWLERPDLLRPALRQFLGRVSPQ
jgi:pimeloyl-ACP methyl ester carboxylesterase